MASMIQKHQIANFGGEEQSVDDGLDSMDEMKTEDRYSDWSCAMNNSLTPLLMISSELNVTKINA